MGRSRTVMVGSTCVGKSLRSISKTPKLNRNSEESSSVSVLANKYLIFGNGSDTRHINSVVKYFKECVHIKTKERFSCKMIVKNQEGLELLDLYYRLGEGYDEYDTSNKVHEVISSAKSFFVIMPPSYGTVLEYAAEKKKLQEPEAASIFQQMVLAVQFCHSKGIVLRDLKMSNFVFRDEARTIVRLGTLEAAALLQNFNDDWQSDKHGCPNYVSPEKAAILGKLNKSYSGRTSDVWGLGIILYTLLVGQYPFIDVDHSSLMKKIQYEPCSFPPNISSSAKFLIRCLLQKDPSLRPSYGEILKAPWIQKGCVENSFREDYNRNNMLPNFRTINNSQVLRNGSSSSLTMNSMHHGEANRTLLIPNNMIRSINTNLQFSNMDVSEGQVVPNM